MCAMNREQAISRVETAAAVAFFVVYGLRLIATQVPFGLWMAHTPLTLLNILSSLVLLLPVGACVGWIKSFPRWSYPYVMHTLVFSGYMTNVSTPGFLFDGEVWGWRAWIPLAGVVVVSLLLTRSLRPLQAFVTNIREERSLLAFGFLGGMPLVMMVCYDEVDWRISLPGMVMFTLLMAGTAFLYMQRASLRTGVNALWMGTLLAIILGVWGSTAYWFLHGTANIVAGVTAGMLTSLLLFLPALISLLPQAKRPGW